MGHAVARVMERPVGGTGQIHKQVEYVYTPSDGKLGLAAGASFGLHIVFVDSAKYVFPPSGPVGTPCVMLRSAVNYEDNFESCVCVLHITSFRLREFLPCKPICFKPPPRPGFSLCTFLTAPPRQADRYLPDRLKRNSP
ncbi:hypothetical protein KM043_018336 [Ampulex compressa]|nr:hypothetical protein KM043_018336 [Ampulex compressa]